MSRLTDRAFVQENCDNYGFREKTQDTVNRLLLLNFRMDDKK